MKNILLCVAGLTPQIITETLHVLTVKQNERIDEVRVITTATGHKLVKERLFDSGVFAQFCIDYPKQTENLYFDLEKCLYLLTDKKTGIPSDADFPEDRLPDIRTTKENEKAANQICEIVRYWTREENCAKVFASVAGGRKMGNYLAFAMSLFARNHDSLSHVLVSEEFERFGKLPVDFYYEPPVSQPVKDIKGNDVFTSDGKPLTTDMARTTLAEIPFVRLRRILGEDYGDEPGEYALFVEQVQAELDLLETDHSIEIYLAENKLKIAKCEFELEPRELWIYTVFALHRKSAATDKDSALTYNQITLDHFDRALRKITAAQSEEMGVTDMIEEYRKMEYKDLKFGFFIDCLYKDLTRINYDVMRDSFTVAVSRLNSKLKEKRIPSRYRIEAREKKGRVKYNWLAVEPDKITFVE
jgi:CRISPR-associated protein (TIGR02584 family)